MTQRVVMERRANIRFYALYFRLAKLAIATPLDYPLKTNKLRTGCLD